MLSTNESSLTVVQCPKKTEAPSPWELNNGQVVLWSKITACILNIYSTKFYQIKKDTKGEENFILYQTVSKIQ